MLHSIALLQDHILSILGVLLELLLESVPYRLGFANDLLR
jgi:hypothetical protein